MIPAIIIARGGSTRLPRKNILPFCGLPLVAWSIIQAKCSHLIDEVYLSTDDQEIADIGKKYGANIIWRTGYAVGDLPPVPVWRHAVKHILEKCEFERVCLMLPTSPCRNPDDIDRAIVEHSKTDKMILRVAALHFPKETEIFEKAGWRTDGNFMFARLFNKHHRYSVGNNIFTIDTVSEILAQPIGPTIRNTSNDLILETIGRNRAIDVFGYVEIEWYQIYDIDYQNELDFCELLMERYILKGHGPEIYEKYARSKS